MASALRLRFLGTGASGGTPGSGRSARAESSALLLDDDTRILLDAGDAVTRHPPGLERCDALLLTHAHRDAVGGIPALLDLFGDGSSRLPILARPATIAVLQRRFGSRLDHCDLRAFVPGDRTRIGGWTISCAAVPHAADEERFPTVAWRLTRSGRSLVYASDVARPTTALRDLARGAAVLVLDAATYRRRVFSHLRIDEDLPIACRWRIERILLTQMGRSVPPHEELEQVVSRLCERAAPAFDGLEVALGAH